MNRLLAMLCLFCLLLPLTACGEKPQDALPAAVSPAEPVDAPQDTVSPEAPPPADTLPGDASERAASSQTGSSAWEAAFAELLRNAHDHQILPDGQVDGADMESIEGNLFAVHDVDGDGRKELILLWQNTYMAGQTEIVYGYDEANGEVQEELRDFPGIIFYDNGTAEAPWSHNQGWAGEFWPYTLYRYQPESGAYENKGSVDAWDASLASSAFPHDADTDGDGMVYVLLTDNWNFTLHHSASGEDYWYYEEPPVDGAEYLAWRNSIVEDADFLELSFVPLTAENIAEVLNVPYVPLAETLHPNAAG